MYTQTYTQTYTQMYTQLYTQVYTQKMYQQTSLWHPDVLFASGSERRGKICELEKIGQREVLVKVSLKCVSSHRPGLAHCGTAWRHSVLREIPHSSGTILKTRVRMTTRL